MFLSCIILICVLGFGTNVQAKVYKLDKTYTFKGTFKKVRFEHPNGTKLMMEKAYYYCTFNLFDAVIEE